MKKKMNLILVLFISFFISTINIKAITREDLQDMVVSTAMSYLHNNTYSDYDQKSMDNTSAVTLKSDGTTNNQSTFNWRNPNVSPEEVRRTNHFSIDCSSFSAIVMKYSLGYDFTEFYDLRKNFGYYSFNAQKEIFTYSKIGASGLTKEEKQGRFALRFQKYGMGLNTSFFTDVAANNLGNPSAGKITRDETNSEVGVYYYQFKESDKKNERIDIYKNYYKKYLEPGDIIVYVTFDGTGHAMVYVGNKLGKEGFIHSTGTDFIQNKDGTWQIGDDKYSIRFDSMETLEARIEAKSIKHLAILRPINYYCNGDTCLEPKTLNTNTKARTELQWLKIEQYATKKKPTINNLNTSATDVSVSIDKYNSVNVGEEITYVLELKNNSNKGYCTGNYGGDYDNETDCPNSDKNWYVPEKTKTYEGLTITSSLPSNTTFVSTSNNCTYSNSKITCKITNSDPLKAGESIKFTYTVKVTGGTEIKSGMTITTQNSNNLQLGQLTTKVNPTNNKINAEQLRLSINKFKNYVANGQVVYGTSNRSKINASVPAKGKGSLTYSAYDFIGRVYYDAFGITINEFSGKNIKNAIFNKSKELDGYGKKTETQIEAMTTGSTEKKLNTMLVKGFYGGRYLKGNDNDDRPGRLRIKDLEVGDVIAYYSTSNGTIAGDSVLYLYLGTDKNDNSTFIRFKKGNTFTTYTTTASTFFYELWTKDLFAVFRPSQLYGTTVKYSGGTISGKTSVVEYSTYKSLKELTSTKEYTIKFDYGDHSNSKWTKEYTGKNIFDGWYSDSKYTKKITNGNTLASTSSHTIYAKWNNFVKLPTATITGYTLDSWCINSSCTGTTYKSGTNYNLKKNQTLYAKWVANTYSVKYNANGGTGTTPNSTHTYNKTSSLTTNKFIKEGYVFSGWSTTKNGEVKYQDGAGVKNLTTGTNTITLYAVWRKKENNEVDIELEVKNGYANATKQTIKSGSNVTFNVYPNKGYTNGIADCTNATLKENELTIKNVTKNTKCKVTYSGIEYDVIYNSSGGTGKMENSVHTYGKSKQLNQIEFTRTGYKFKGWSTSQNGTVKYKDKENVVNLTTSKNFNLYAIWSPVNYSITYELNGGTLDNKVTSYKITSKDITLGEPIKEGYSFTGWTTSDNKTPNKKITIKNGSTGNKTFTANYQTGKYKITYKSDKYGSITGLKEETLSYKSSPSGTIQTTNKGYNMLKWAVNKDVTLKDGTTILEGNSITEEQIKEIIIKEDIVITAYHYAKKYKISYQDGSNGIVNGIESEEVSYSSNPLGTKVKANTGYKFKYWTANKKVKLNNGKTISKGKEITNVKSIVVSEDLVLTPYFEKETYIISYQSDENGIILGIENETKTYPNTLSSTSIQTIDENYEFKNWTSNVDVVLNDDRTIKSGEPILEEDLKNIVATNNMILTANFAQSLYNVYYLNHEDIIVTENTKEEVAKDGALTGPVLERNRWDKTVVYTSDKDVTLTNGKTIKAGKAITEEQLKQIVVLEDLNITPRYESDLQLLNPENLNMDLILTIIFVVLVIGLGFYIYKTKKK